MLEYSLKYLFFLSILTKSQRLPPAKLPETHHNVLYCVLQTDKKCSLIFKIFQTGSGLRHHVSAHLT